MEIEDIRGEIGAEKSYPIVVEGPTYIGGYRFGSSEKYFTQLNLTYKPNWFHRLLMRILLGLYWFDK